MGTESAAGLEWWIGSAADEPIGTGAADLVNSAATDGPIGSEVAARSRPPDYATTDAPTGTEVVAKSRALHERLLR